MNDKELSIQEAIKSVRVFHDAFGISNSDKPTSHLAKGQKELRFELMKEENEEYLQAAEDENIVEIADALGDMLYILCGTILKHGLQEVISDVFKEIQDSNMSKLDEDGKPIYRADGKVLKSNLYFKPKIAEIIARHLPSQ